MKIDVVIRMLSLCNQLASCLKDVHLQFTPPGDLSGYSKRQDDFLALGQDRV
jgi:hypothetical protein